jgi:hypothetical protein
MYRWLFQTAPQGLSAIEASVSFIRQTVLLFHLGDDFHRQSEELMKPPHLSGRTHRLHPKVDNASDTANTEKKRRGQDVALVEFQAPPFR